MKVSALLFICLQSIIVNSQEKSILVFDLVNQTLDSITNINYNTNILSENTKYNTGCFNSYSETLNNTPTNSNVFPGSQFTLKKKASSDFDISNYPIRTSVKIFHINNDSLHDLCSGSLISKRHIITAAHCVSSLTTNQLIFDSLYVSPIFDNGEFNTNFKSSYVSKIYFFDNWSLNGEDIAILELKEPIGISTGWISIGFETQDTLLKQGVFYKFSYPTATNLAIDPNEYNGDSLYYNYGAVDNISEHRISVNNATGIGGESGSSIIKIENGNKYITYGVLSLTSNISHSRINNWRYYAIKSIIIDDLIVTNNNVNDNIILYPNPTDNIINIKNIEKSEILELILYDNMGRRCLFQNKLNPCLNLEISNLPNGIYYLEIKTPELIVTKKIIKNSY